MHSLSSSEKSKLLGLPSKLSSGAYISSCALAGNLSFIYSIVELDIGAIYIGQTINSNGPLARLSQHLSWSADSNTFRKRVTSAFNLAEVEFNGIHLIGVPLPDEPRFQAKARDYREAVESIVHDVVLEYLTDRANQIGLTLVSWAYRHPYRKDKDIALLGRRIGAEICEWLELIRNR